MVCVMNLSLFANIITTILTIVFGGLKIQEKLTLTLPAIFTHTRPQSVYSAAIIGINDTTERQHFSSPSPQRGAMSKARVSGLLRMQACALPTPLRRQPGSCTRPVVIPFTEAFNTYSFSTTLPHISSIPEKRSRGDAYQIIPNASYVAQAPLPFLDIFCRFALFALSSVSYLAWYYHQKPPKPFTTTYGQVSHKVPFKTLLIQSTTVSTPAITSVASLIDPSPIVTSNAATSDFDILCNKRPASEKPVIAPSPSIKKHRNVSRSLASQDSRATSSSSFLSESDPLEEEPVRFKFSVQLPPPPTIIPKKKDVSLLTWDQYRNICRRQKQLNLDKYYGPQQNTIAGSILGTTQKVSEAIEVCEGESFLVDPTPANLVPDQSLAVQNVSTDVSFPIDLPSASLLDGLPSPPSSPHDTTLIGFKYPSEDTWREAPNDISDDGSFVSFLADFSQLEQDSAAQPSNAVSLSHAHEAFPVSADAEDLMVTSAKRIPPGLIPSAGDQGTAGLHIDESIDSTPTQSDVMTSTNDVSDHLMSFDGSQDATRMMAVHDHIDATPTNAVESPEGIPGLLVPFNGPQDGTPLDEQMDMDPTPSRFGIMPNTSAILDSLTSTDGPQLQDTACIDMMPASDFAASPVLLGPSTPFKGPQDVTWMLEIDKTSSAFDEIENGVASAALPGISSFAVNTEWSLSTPMWAPPLFESLPFEMPTTPLESCDLMIVDPVSESSTPTCLDSDTDITLVSPLMLEHGLESMITRRNSYSASSIHPRFGKTAQGENTNGTHHPRPRSTSAPAILPGRIDKGKRRMTPEEDLQFNLQQQTEKRVDNVDEDPNMQQLLKDLQNIDEQYACRLQGKKYELEPTDLSAPNNRCNDDALLEFGFEIANLPTQQVSYEIPNLKQNQACASSYSSSNDLVSQSAVPTLPSTGNTPFAIPSTSQPVDSAETTLSATDIDTRESRPLKRTKLLCGPSASSWGPPSRSSSPSETSRIVFESERLNVDGDSSPGLAPPPQVPFIDLSLTPNIEPISIADRILRFNDASDVALTEDYAAQYPMSLCNSCGCFLPCLCPPDSSTIDSTHVAARIPDTRNIDTSFEYFSAGSQLADHGMDVATDIEVLNDKWTTGGQEPRQFAADHSHHFSLNARNDIAKSPLDILAEVAANSLPQPTESLIESRPIVPLPKRHQVTSASLLCPISTPAEPRSIAPLPSRCRVGPNAAVESTAPQDNQVVFMVTPTSKFPENPTLVDVSNDDDDDTFEPDWVLAAQIAAEFAAIDKAQRLRNNRSKAGSNRRRGVVQS